MTFEQLNELVGAIRIQSFSYDIFNRTIEMDLTPEYGVLPQIKYAPDILSAKIWIAELFSQEHVVLQDMPNGNLRASVGWEIHAPASAYIFRVRPEL